MDNEFSFIIPAYNREHTLPRCLDSIGAQTYRPLHVVIVDNGSSDATVQVAEQWKRTHENSDLRVTVLTETSRGASAARNAGLAIATSSFCVFTDSDDTVRTDLAATAMAAIAEHPDTDLLCWKVEAHRPDGTSFTMPYTPDMQKLMKTHLLHAALRTQAFAVRTDFLRNAGGWNTSLPAWNDWELGFRLLADKPRCRFIDRTLADYYLNPVASITGDGFLHKAGRWEKSALAIADHAAERLPRRKADAVRNVMAYRLAVLAADYLREGASTEISAPTLTHARTLVSSPMQRMAVGTIFSLRRHFGLRGLYLLMFPSLHRL